MAAQKTTTSTDGRDLLLRRVINAPPEKVFRAWTEPALLKRWFAPAPWTTPIVETDVRAGGSSFFVMRSPEGAEFPNRGVYLEVVNKELLVFRDASNKAWDPSDKPFMTVIVTFENKDGRTGYQALVRHWTIADREAHEQMGFHQGWAQCAEQRAGLR